MNDTKPRVFELFDSVVHIFSLYFRRIKLYFKILYIFQCVTEYFCIALLTLKLLIVIILQEVMT